jgi:hypothetical protein
MRKSERTARTDPRRSPMFQRTIARGMNASGRKIIDASRCDTVEVILDIKTGETEEIQRHRKFARAGHRSLEVILFQLDMDETNSGNNFIGAWRTRNLSAHIDAKPTTTADRK